MNGVFSSLESVELESHSCLSVYPSIHPSIYLNLFGQTTQAYAFISYAVATQR